MSKGEQPDDPMAAARERWLRSVGSEGRSFEAACQSIEEFLTEVEERVARLSSDPELSEQPEGITEPSGPDSAVPNGVLSRQRVTILHERFVRPAANQIRERLRHPDLDLAGIVACRDLLLFVVNSLGSRLEPPARRGNRSIRGSKKGGVTTRNDRTRAQAAEASKLTQIVQATQKKNPSLKSARSLAKVVARQMEIGPERIRKRIIELGLTPKRPTKRKTKKMGRVGPA